MPGWLDPGRQPDPPSAARLRAQRKQIEKMRAEGLQVPRTASESTCRNCGYMVSVHLGVCTKCGTLI